MSGAAKMLKDQKNLIPINSPVPNRRILVVDDEPEIANGIHRVLCPQGENVIAFQSSRSKKKAVSEKENEFDVVVVNTPSAAIVEVEKSLEMGQPFAMGFFDVMLGADIDGIELVKQIFSKDPTLQAVFVTAYHDRSVDTIGSYLGEGSRERWDYINKPFTEGEILQKARNATSLWDLNRLKEWQADRLSEAHQLLMANEKQNAIAAIGRSVAHEFGNLLTHIIGHTEIALSSTDLNDIKNSLNIILKAGQTASTVLTNFRNLNKDSEQKHDYKIIAINHVIEEALELMEFRFRRHSIKVIKTDVKNHTLEVNKSALVQVFANVFINAIHVMPRGGTLTIASEVKEDGVCIQITDTGPGVPPENLEKVMQPLFTTKGNEGTGLGLSICKEIVEIEHQGCLILKNSAQGGACVEITLPRMRGGDDG